jgi:hypothetical protein
MSRVLFDRVLGLSPAPSLVVRLDWLQHRELETGYVRLGGYCTLGLGVWGMRVPHQGQESRSS